MTRRECDVCIVYPADPSGVIPGGIDTFIRGMLRWAPEDIKAHVVGITTDPVARPVGRWMTCHLGEQSFQFYPILALKNSERQAIVPVVLRFLSALLRTRPRISADVLEFHRVEPTLAFLRDRRPKTLVMHQNMDDLRNTDSDIRWRYLPSLYFKLEQFALPRMSSIYCVREDASESYRERFSALGDRIHFTPTWVDTGIFHLPVGDEGTRHRQQLNSETGFSNEHFVLMTVGRLDRQKNPLLLVDAFHQLQETMPDARLMFVGDGVLRRQLAERIERYKLEDKVRLCGVKSAPEISRYLQAADVFVLSSAYEGMPMCVLEALGAGLPVVATDVGEVSRAVKPGVNGELVSSHDAESLANAISECRRNIERYRGFPCWDAVQAYTPQRVLAPIYENYRRLATQNVTYPAGVGKDVRD